MAFNFNPKNGVKEAEYYGLDSINDEIVIDIDSVKSRRWIVTERTSVSMTFVEMASAGDVRAIRSMTIVANEESMRETGDQLRAGAVFHGDSIYDILAGAREQGTLSCDAQLSSMDMSYFTFSIV